MAFVKRELTRDDEAWLRAMKAPTFIAGDYGACIVEDVKKKIALVCLGGQGVMTENGKQQRSFGNDKRNPWGIWSR